MNMLRRLVAAAAVVALLSAVSEAPAWMQGFSDPQRSEIERIIKEYLLRYPEILQEAIAELEKKQAAADAIRHKTAIQANEKLLFNSPRQATIGNLQGDVTLVEFFDYNCSFCRRALADKLALLKADPKLRVVLKEFPVLGAGSVEAAQVATAVRMQDSRGKKYLEFHQKLLAGRGQADRARAMAVAREIGLDMPRLEKDMASEEVRLSLAESMGLAEALGVNGTPTYVVGAEIVVGAVGFATMSEKIAAARACAANASC